MTDGTDVLILGNGQSPALRYHVPVGLPDPIAYIEHDGGRYVFAWPFDVDNLRAVDPDLEVISFDDCGVLEVLRETGSVALALQEAVARGCERIGLIEAVTPIDFPLGIAEALRRRGIRIEADSRRFEERRRHKTPGQIAGIRRAIKAAEAGIAAICDRLRSGEPVESDQLKVVAWQAYPERFAQPNDMLIVACGPQSFHIHEEGHGLISPQQPILIDILARDRESGCWADLSRTVCLGAPPERLRRCHDDVRQAQQLAIEAARPGIGGDELDGIAARYLADRGHPTRLDHESGDWPEEGFVHNVGHGVGLDIHEAPSLAVPTLLVPGDVVTIEPGLYYQGFGGVRIEDMLLITETGHEVLSHYPYDLEL